MKLFRLFPLLVVLSALSDAAAADEPVRPKLSCADLRSFTSYGFSIATATLVPATADVPEHCRVSGQILPEIRFEVSLPSQWNRRFYMFGNGGYAGESFESPGRVNQRNAALRRGFAVAATDTGHDATVEPLGTFAMNRQKLLDYAFRAVHVTAETGKRVTREYYGTEIARSYFQGCSTGGRQALILAQRFPKDFDGIVVGAPVLDFSGTMTSYAWTSKGLLEGPVSIAKLKLLADRIYAGCDETDGIKDGVIEDPRRCGFSPARDLPRCPAEAEGPDCFTPRQIAALERIYNDMVVGGKRLFPGWPVGAEAAGPNGRPGWEGWIVRDDARTTQVNFLETFFRYMAFPERDPNYDWTRFNFETDSSRMDWIRKVLDATDPDLTSFRATGGKILMYYGWADPALNARMGVEYYEKVLARMGPSTTEFYRLFMVPGMFHCGGGVGLNTFDWLTPLIDWVEKGVAPDVIVGSRMVEGTVVWKRPVCPYPKTARYKGTGAIDDSAAFECK